MGEKDIQGKRLEDEPDVFADIVNVTGFHGVRLVKPDTLVAGPTASLYTMDDGRQRCWTFCRHSAGTIGMPMRRRSLQR